MSGSHVMVPTNILRGSVHVHEMRKRKLILIKEVFSLKKFGGSFNWQDIDKLGSLTSITITWQETSGYDKLKTDGSALLPWWATFLPAGIWTQASHSALILVLGMDSKGKEVYVKCGIFFVQSLFFCSLLLYINKIAQQGATLLFSVKKMWHIEWECMLHQ
jgi:hypothetical protein